MDLTSVLFSGHRRDILRPKAPAFVPLWRYLWSPSPTFSRVGFIFARTLSLVARPPVARPPVALSNRFQIPRTSSISGRSHNGLYTRFFPKKIKE